MECDVKKQRLSKKPLDALLLAVGAFAVINAEMGVTGILPQVAAEYEIDVAKAGLLVSLFALVVAVSGPIVPLLFSRAPRKRAMLLTLAAFAVCSFAAAFAPTFEALLVVRILPAFLQPLYIAFALAEATDRAPKGMETRATARVMMGVSAGMVLGVPCVNWLSGTFSVAAGMLFTAAIGAVALLLLAWGLPDRSRAEVISYGAQLSYLRKPQTWITMAGVMVLNGGPFGVYSFLSAYLGEVVAFAAPAVSVALLAYGAMGLVGNAFAGVALSRRARAFTFALPGAFLTVFVLFIVFREHVMAAWLLTMIFGVLAGCVGLVNQQWMAAALPDAPEFANGLYLGASNLGITLGTSLAGGIIGAAGLSNVPMAGIVLVIPVFALLAARYGLMRMNGRMDDINNMSMLEER